MSTITLQEAQSTWWNSFTVSSLRGLDRHRERPTGRPAHSRAHRPAKPSLAPAAGDRGAQGRTG